MGSKGKGFIAYFFGWLGGLIVLFAFKDNNRKDVIHACQSITLSVAQIVAGIVISVVNTILYSTVGFQIPLVSGIINLLCFGLCIYGIVKAVRDDADPKLPVVGDLTMKFFEKKINETPEQAAAPQANFDPNTGQPVTQPQANFDPTTGQPINQTPQANFDPTTGQPTSENTTPTNNDQN